ncbi:MAG: hypothetical protein ACETWM_15220 [Candidatus Lokiarchaeia archaeon]
MINLGMCYCPEDTLADIFKPLLPIIGALAGVRIGGPLGALFGAISGGVVGGVSMLPQVDQFYHERIWPIVKFTLGAAIMGTEGIIYSTIINTVALTGISAAEHAWENQVFGDPWYQDVQINWMPILEFLPLDTWGPQDYINSWITKYVYGMWWF